MKNVLLAILLPPICAAAQKIELSASAGVAYFNHISDLKTTTYDKPYGFAPIAQIGLGYKLKRFRFGVSSDISSIAPKLQYNVYDQPRNKFDVYSGKYKMSAPSISAGIYGGYSISAGPGFVLVNINAGLILGGERTWDEYSLVQGQVKKVLIKDGTTSGYYLGVSAGYEYRLNDMLAFTLSIAPRRTVLSFKDTKYPTKDATVFQMPVTLGAIVSL